jgi:hypothetical protein
MLGHPPFGVFRESEGVRLAPRFRDDWELAAKRDQILCARRGHGNGQRPGVAGKDDANHQPALAQKKRAPEKQRWEWRGERICLGFRTDTGSPMIFEVASNACIERTGHLWTLRVQVYFRPIKFGGEILWFLSGRWETTWAQKR